MDDKDIKILHKIVETLKYHHDEYCNQYSIIDCSHCREMIKLLETTFNISLFEIYE